MRVSDLELPSAQGPLDALYTPPSLIHLLESGHWDAAEEKLLAVCAELDEKWSESWSIAWRLAF